MIQAFIYLIIFIVLWVFIYYRYIDKKNNQEKKAFGKKEEAVLKYNEIEVNNDFSDSVDLSKIEVQITYKNDDVFSEEGSYDLSLPVSQLFKEKKEEIITEISTKETSISEVELSNLVNINKIIKKH